MLFSSEQLLNQVIQPTLDYLGVSSESAPYELLSALQERAEVGLFATQPAGLGLYQITAAQHRDLWDRHLAFRPDVASRVRGLASQRAFLSNPERELQTNLGYSTAVAWLLLQRARGERETGPGISHHSYAQASMPALA